MFEKVDAYSNETVPLIQNNNNAPVNATELKPGGVDDTMARLRISINRNSAKATAAIPIATASFVGAFFTFGATAIPAIASLAVCATTATRLEESQKALKNLQSALGQDVNAITKRILADAFQNSMIDIVDIRTHGLQNPRNFTNPTKFSDLTYALATTLTEKGISEERIQLLTQRVKNIITDPPKKSSKNPHISLDSEKIANIGFGLEMATDPVREAQKALAEEIVLGAINESTKIKTATANHWRDKKRETPLEPYKVISKKKLADLYSRVLGKIKENGLEASNERKDELKDELKATVLDAIDSSRQKQKGNRFTRLLHAHVNVDTKKLSFADRVSSSRESSGEMSPDFL